MPLPLFEHTVWGNKNGPSLVLLAGWPDTAHIWESNVVAKFSEEYNIVGLTLPGYTTASVATTPRWGWSFSDLNAMYGATLRQLQIDGVISSHPVGVGHDWGAAILGEFVHHEPRFFSKVVFLDVVPYLGDQDQTSLSGLLLGKHLSMPFSRALIILWYQLTLAFAYSFSLVPGLGFIGAAVNRFILWFFGDGCPRYNRNPLANPREKGYEGVHCGMNYLYVRLWAMFFTFRAPSSIKSNKMPVVPVLYCYGLRKPCHFHSNAWLKHLASRKDGSRAISYDADHWFYVDPTREVDAQFLGDLALFLKQ